MGAKQQTNQQHRVHIPIKCSMQRQLTEPTIKKNNHQQPIQPTKNLVVFVLPKPCIVYDVPAFILSRLTSDVNDNFSFVCTIKLTA